MQIAFRSLLIATLLVGVSFSAMAQLPDQARTANSIPTFASQTGKYLVEWTSTEKCYDCGFSYAMNCAPGNPGCNTPDKAVLHYAEFKTIKEALTFINAGFTGPTTILSGSYGAAIAASLESGPRALHRLLSFTEVPLEKDVRVTETPQPAKREEKTTYRYGQEIGDVREPAAAFPGTSTGITSLAASGAIVLPSATVQSPGCLQLTGSGSYKYMDCPKEKK